MNHVLLFLFASFLISTTSHVGAIDFCIGDLKGAETPAGYPCKPSTNVTVDDFVYTLTKSPPNNFNFSISTAFVDQFPALNGLGFSIAKAELEGGAVIPLHAHPDATEIIIGGPGNVTAGFITSTDNKVFVKTLVEGNIFVIPRGLLHFVINNGKDKAIGNVVFTSVKPSVQLLDLALFGNDFDSALVSKTTFLDLEQVKKLKAVFKGTG